MFIVKHINIHILSLIMGFDNRLDRHSYDEMDIILITREKLFNTLCLEWLCSKNSRGK